MLGEARCDRWDLSVSRRSGAFQILETEQEDVMCHLLMHYLELSVLHVREGLSWI